MSTSRLKRLLNPETIAVVGGDAAAFVIDKCWAFGFRGEVWGVNPKRAELAGAPCFAGLGDLPSPPDAALIIVPDDPSVGLVGELSDMGGGGAVCFAAGFSEIGGAGKTRQQALVEAAGDMPVIGPNCHGLLNYLNGAVLWPDQHGGERVESGVAIVSQSGNMAINFTMQRRGLPLAMLISLGNQAVTGVEDCVNALLDDPRITAIGMHIEGLTDISGFVGVADKARQRRVPLVALKTGRSEQAAAITMGHTASLAGPDRLYSALFDRTGVARVGTVDDFIETLKFLSVHGPLPGNRLSSLSCSGGEAGLIADLAERTDLVFPGMTPAHRDRVRATLSDYVNISNPLDYHTFIWGDEDKLTACFAAMFSGDFDLNILIVDYPRDDRCETAGWRPVTEAVITARRKTGARVAVLSTLGENLPEEECRRLLGAGIAPMHGMSQALAAFSGAWAVHRQWTSGPPMPYVRNGRATDNSDLWDEARSKSWLSGLGVSVPAGKVCMTAWEAVDAARKMDGRVVLKVVGEEIAHKTEISGVAVGLRGEDEILPHAERLLALGGHVLVEEMIEDAVCEMLLGLNVDRQFGPHLVVGAGGTLVDLLEDSRLVLLPADREAVRQALSRLRVWPILTGYRGGVKADVDALIDHVLMFADIAVNEGERIAEIDVNPLMVRAEGQGVVAADAVIRMNRENDDE